MGHHCKIRGSRSCKQGGEPIELHLLFVPEYELRGAALKRGAPGAAVTGENKLGSKNRQIARQSVFKRLARQSGLYGSLARVSSSQQFDHAGLLTAWKYVYLFREGHRLTRYVE